MATRPLPLFSYAATVGIHNSLLLFTALFLPRTSLTLFGNTSNFPFLQSASSLDRPQPEFLEALTASPPLTLAWLCAGVSLISFSWGVRVRRQAYEQHKPVAKADFEAKKGEVEWQKQGTINLRKSFISTLPVAAIFHALIVVFGAPITSYHLQTFLLALLLSLLTYFPTAYVLGPPSFAMFKDGQADVVLRFTWVRIFAEFKPRTDTERALLYPVLGAMIGTWCGVIPIGLDWDRPWQAWPLTPAYGAIFGHVLGSLAAFSVSFIYLLAQANIQATAELDTIAKAPESSTPKTKATKAKAKKKVQ
ncbi:hypothetical protein BDM02DRAFT_3144582 [Thelephora ganbajun]|uniref:Uncharacterized protein n=1 Tax=Thelephora ganbajun TaxID=370292 RepID=A0ACB6ZFV6_THEGA|nr:hypothetical protein BDM02DRAFT_3144582 [Thelephora ganbajun]